MSTKHKKTDDPSEVHLPSTWTPPGRLSKALVVPPHTAENAMAACTKDSFSMNGFFSQRAVCLPLSPKSTPFRELSGEVRMSSRILIATYGWQDSPQSPRATAACSQRRVVRKLFGELVSNIPRAFLHIHRTLHHAHTVAITFSFLCGLIYCVRTLVTVSAKLSRA